MSDTHKDLSALTNGAPEHTVDELLGLLSEREIRTTLGYLYDHSDATVDELAAVVAGTEAVGEETIAGQRAYDRARISLHHSVLPQLDDHGLLEFDPDAGAVDEVDIPSAVYEVLGVGG
ncbi:DUF7344 domain-containing protein [Natronococcus occultus]|uniref:DUF7344 domain-containing protein n=1 Tax=Natronococcus occultus SP4 TaxID=694430 RepID=L0K6G8_9EURY|nr:hypothetical protein [Natronococcus occultus]AGB39728.1 hypothetical protein Natoc_4030 [Natronococcus occultus SP4]